jgi:hypothetical protein
MMCRISARRLTPGPSLQTAKPQSRVQKGGSAETATCHGSGCHIFVPLGQRMSFTLRVPHFGAKAMMCRISARRLTPGPSLQTAKPQSRVQKGGSAETATCHGSGCNIVVRRESRVCHCCNVIDKLLPRLNGLDNLRRLHFIQCGFLRVPVPKP